MTEIALFSDGEFRLEITPHDTDGFRVAAPAVARQLGFRDAARMLETVPAAEKGYTLASTPGGEQRVSYLTEKGFYRVLGQRQAARVADSETRAFVERFQDWVYGEVLPKLRRGELVPAPRELSRLELIDIARAAEVGRLEEKAAREIAEQERDQLVPAASAWHGLVDRTGDISVGEAAKALRRAGADTGPNRLFRTLDQLGWIWKDARNDWRVKQSAIETGRLSERLTGTYEHPDTGQRVAAPPQVRVTFKGLDALHAHFVGARVLPVRRQLSSAGGAA